MPQYIMNAAPMVIDLGTADLSTRTLPRVPEDIPQHLPKIYLYAEKGPLTPQLVVGNERDLMFGSNTFDLSSKYANHATVFANAINAEGNTCMIQRVIPDDIGPAANIRVWLDVLACDIPQYERGVDGMYVLDNNNNPIPVTPTTGTPATVPGYKVKWITDSDISDNNSEFGTLSSKTGTQTIVDNTDPLHPITTTSTKYPIFELVTSSIGGGGNNIGFSLYAPTSQSSPMPLNLMSKERVYPYYMTVQNRMNSSSSGSIVKTVLGDIDVMVSFKDNVIDPITTRQLNILKTFITSYQNISDPAYPPLYGSFGKMAVYGDINSLLAEFYNSERTTNKAEYNDSLHPLVPSYVVGGYVDDFIDATHPATPTDYNLFNFVSGVNSDGQPYNSYRIDASGGTVFTTYVNHWCDGGSDGTINDDNFDALVAKEITRYSDPLDILQELALNVESIFYDTGFALSTKKELVSFISTRKDTFLVLSTHTHGQPGLDEQGEISLSNSLKTYLVNYPESSYFGTRVMRAIIIGRSASLINSPYTDRLPVSYELAIKAARYMGAGIGKWKAGFSFDSAPNNILQYMHNVNISWVPAIVRNQLWDIGLNWIQAYDRRSYMFPALKTVYEDDTSVLTNFLTVMAVCQLHKIADSAWRNFTGNADLTNTQFIAKVNEYIKGRTLGIFDNRYIIEPAAFISAMDELRGYSITCPIRIYASNMKTVFTVYVEALRLSDYNPISSAG